MKLKVNDTYKKGEEITTNIERQNVDGVVNKAYLLKKKSKKERVIYH